MPKPVQDVLLVPVDEPAAPHAPPQPSTGMMARSEGESGLVAVLERLALNPDVPVDKLERIVTLLERGEARKAEMTFNAAMSAAQQEMRPVAADAENPQTRSRYASYQALDRTIRPIYTKHGFALSFNTGDAPLTDYVRVLCDVTHMAGHTRTYTADMPADGKGAKGGDVMTKTHAVGSAMSYGMRYLLKMIFNVAVMEDDDDGNKAAGAKVVDAPPTGYGEWVTDLAAAADEGIAKLTTTWNRSKLEYREHLLKSDRPGWDRLKAKAQAVRA